MRRRLALLAALVAGAFALTIPAANAGAQLCLDAEITVAGQTLVDSADCLDEGDLPAPPAAPELPA
jgi:hypothetical protein